MTRFFIHLGWLFIAAAFTNPFSAWAGSVDKTTDAGKVRVHFPDQAQSQCTAFLLGVGTAMSASGYDKLSSRISQYGHVVVVMDHAPGALMKTDEHKFRRLAEDVKAQLTQWLPNDRCQIIDKWIMGGHSAGGQAAQNAVAHNAGLADGIFSIDPYNANDTDDVHVPALYWGFSKTTCFVAINDAAKGTYQRSRDRRAFYRVNTKYSWGPCGYSPKYFHCSFCDGHCPVCTNCQTTPDHFFDDVAASVNQFAQHGFTSTWSKAAMTINSTTPYTLFVDNDQP